MKTIALRLRYDGTAYHGWQVQKEDRSVCGTLNEALEKVFGERVRAVGCGRTDAGVHALRYCASFRTECSIPLERIPFAVNSRLPRDISVTDAVEAPEHFNAIGCCRKKEYIYLIYNSRIRDPFLANRVCFYPQKLDLYRMQKAAAAFEGTHDFAAVRSVGTPTRTTVRTVYRCCVTQEGPLIRIAVCADGFLYNMCRAIAGTLVYASYGKLEPEEIPSLLEKRDRRLTGPTMPPQGLYLYRVWYEGEVGKMMDKPDADERAFFGLFSDKAEKQRK
jgi:tRNA pseudouridine38-40 synthase